MEKNKLILKQTLKFIGVGIGVAIFSFIYFMVIPAFIFGKFPITLNKWNLFIVEMLLTILMLLILYGIRLVVAKRKVAK